MKLAKEMLFKTGKGDRRTEPNIFQMSQIKYLKGFPEAIRKSEKWNLEDAD